MIYPIRFDTISHHVRIGRTVLVNARLSMHFYFWFYSRGAPSGENEFGAVLNLSSHCWLDFRRARRRAETRLALPAIYSKESKAEENLLRIHAHSVGDIAGSWSDICDINPSPSCRLSSIPYFHTRRATTHVYSSSTAHRWTNFDQKFHYTPPLILLDFYLQQQTKRAHFLFSHCVFLLRFNIRKRSILLFKLSTSRSTCDSPISIPIEYHFSPTLTRPTLPGLASDVKWCMHICICNRLGLGKWLFFDTFKLDLFNDAPWQRGK